MAEKTTFSGNDTIKTALQLIRYDIPVMILGKSSIGKSYTLIDITKKWRIPHQLLYIGSEKSENIEGIPKITERKANKEILEYLKPYWFPNEKVINKSVANGKQVFTRFVNDYWKTKSSKEFKVDYINLNSILNGLSNVEWDNSMLNAETNTYKQEVTLVDYEWIDFTGREERILNIDKPFPFEKQGMTDEDEGSGEYFRDDVADLCAYVRTIMGYGNYWLILDEIDKVMEEDQDKFAPLLHIVRERTLKNFTMVDINDGKGSQIPIGKSFVDGGYEQVKSDIDKQIVSGESVLDTRVMAIANKTKNIENALFRRFIQLIAEEVMIWRPQDHKQEQTAVVNCLTDVKTKMIDAGIESGSLIVNEAQIQRLDEVNLQWQYNFFPKIINEIDIAGNFFRLNAVESYDKAAAEGLDWVEERKFTAFWHILDNNFKVRQADFSLPAELWRCLEPQLLEIGSTLGVSESELTERERGISGIISSKIDELGDLSLAAEDIADNLRQKYPTRPPSSTDKLSALYNWTDDIIEYLKSAMYENEVDVVPMDISKYLIPLLVNVFYTELANDKNIVIDNYIAVIERFKNFFKQVANDEPAFTYKCDKVTTEISFYGGTKDEISDWSESEEKSYSENSLYGTNKKFWIDSASGKLTEAQMEDGLALAIPLMVQILDEDEAIDFFLDREGSLTYLSKNYSKELSEISDQLDKQFQTQKKAGNNNAAQNFYNAREFVNNIINSDV